MTDNVSKEKRSEIMASVKSKNTKPELFVRRLLFNKGFRFRLHSRSLPGCPDMVFPKYKTVLFVNGCFWHGHESCKRSKLPGQNNQFWAEKQSRNQKRDRENNKILKELGWKVIIVWECQIPRSNADPFWEDLAARIRNTEVAKSSFPEIE